MIFLFLFTGCQVMQKAMFWKKADVEETVVEPEETEEEISQKRRLENLQRGRNDLMKAIIEGDNAESRRLILSGYMVNASDNGGKTALHFAIERCNVPVAYLLMDHQASVFARDIAGQSMMHYAAQAKCTRLLRAVQNRGLDPDSRDKFGRTAIMIAAMNYHAEIIQAMLEMEADVHVRDHAGKTALFYAAERLDFYEAPPPDEEQEPEILRVRRSDSWPPYVRRPYQTVADATNEVWTNIKEFDYSRLNPFSKEEPPPAKILTFKYLLAAHASLEDMDYTFNSVHDILRRKDDPEILSLIQDYL